MTKPVRCVAAAGVLGLAGLSVGVIAQTTADPIRIVLSVPAPETAAASESLGDRQTAMRDLEAAIEETSGRLRVVESADAADVVLEVVRRDVVEPARSSSSRSRVELRTAMKIGAYQRQFVGRASKRSVASGSQAAAAEVVEQLARWLKANHGPVIARRSNPGLDVRAALSAERARMTGIRAANALRALAAAQDAYASFNQGLFGPIECLHSPISCVPTIGPNSPLLRPRDLAIRGYTGTFHPGAAPSHAELRRMGAGSGSLETWTYYFDPDESLTGAPTLCADSAGRLCRLTSDASAPRRASCPVDCEDLK